MPPATLTDLATVALVGLIAFVSLPLASDLSSWLVGAGLFGGSFLLAYGASSLAAPRRRDSPSDGEGAVDH